MAGARAFRLLLGGSLLLGCATPGGGSLELDRALHAGALQDRAAFRAGLERSCDELATADRLIQEAIAIGAPIYNAGSPLGCYRIYEGTAYKILWTLEDRCPRLGALLRAGLAQAEVDGLVADKAWTLRRTFDAILGERTRFGPSS